jgi:hypothetical protein
MKLHQLMAGEKKLFSKTHYQQSIQMHTVITIRQISAGFSSRQLQGLRDIKK